jgi:hypothetical protein
LDLSGTQVLVLVIGGALTAMTIYTAATRRSGGKYLCDDCRFNSPENCQKPERPRALVCTSYRAVNETYK